MIFDLDELLDQVDEWKFQLQDELAAMTTKQRAAHWKRILKEARARGFTILKPVGSVQRRPKRQPRKTD
jgi:hypothetical protein